MIISDREKFVFIHNPKAGGMTFRLALMKYETRGNPFFEWRRVGHDRVQRDLAHLPLVELRRFFPEVIDQVADYFRFGFVRNPYTRYLSAVAQHLRLAGHVRRAIMSDPALFYHFANTFAQISLREGFVSEDFRLVHFRRQSDFLYFGELRWVAEVLKLEQPETIAASPAARWLGNAAGVVRNPTEAFAGTGYDLNALTSDTRGILEDFYGTDFDRFAYDRI